ncbi:MAG: VWA domain-containing protein, partial [Bdellovibrionales bacterium]|nr:VWA domain-containing protein [Bdellovibrionales bacterium]
MKFGNLEYLWLIWLVPAVTFFLLWAAKRKTLLIERFVSATLRDRLLVGFSYTRQRVKMLLLLLAVVAIIFALIRPQWGYRWEEIKRRGVDIIVALDLSQSMMAQDVSPNRLERAKREIMDLMNIMQGDRLGLIAFAGTAFLQSPLTLDYGAVQIFLDELDTELIPVAGTAMGEAISLAIKSFDQKDKKSRVLILITDGEDHGGRGVEMAQKAKESNVKIYTVGIGGSEGAPIPERERGGFKKDRQGNLILTQLDETALQKMALSTGGSYVRSISGDLDLERIYQDISSKVEDKDLKSGRRRHYEERFQWFLLLALIFLIAELLLPERRRTRQKRGGTLFSWGLVAILIVGVAPNNSFAFWGEEGATQAYQRQDYGQALKGFLEQGVSDPSNLATKYNLANTYYRSGDYQKAYELFSSLASKGENPLAAKSFYNLGNSAYRLGKLQEALNFYQQAVQLNPDDQDAKFNIQFVRQEIKRRIEENKKRQQ